MPGFTIEELPVPARIDDAGAADFVTAMEVGNVVWAEGYGTPDMSYEPAEELPQFLNPYQPIRLLVARVEGRIVAQATTETQTGEGADTSWVQVLVHADFRGRGIGRALADRIEESVRADGRRKAVAYVAGPLPRGPRLESPTGFGAVRAEARETRFLLARGYALEQVERLSRLELPYAPLDAELAAAQAATGPDYVIHSWVGATPERWREDRALLATRMSTDAPSAGLEEPEDVWDVARLLDSEARQAASPRRHLVSVAEHVPSGHLVGYTMLSVPAQRHRAVQQYATLVLREHRGHRLGMLLKLANLRQLEDVAAGHPSVMTFNAEENRPMLDVNERMGFRPVAAEGAWRKDL